MESIMYSYFPDEILEIIISYCGTSSLLQLRLTSVRTKRLVDFSQRLKDCLKAVQINLHISTLQTFLETAPPFPFCNFHIDLSPPLEMRDKRGNLRQSRHWNTLEFSASDNPQFYTNIPHITKFKESYCPRIRKLRLSSMFGCTVDSELNFFQTLKSLEDIEIHVLMPLVPNETINRVEAKKYKLTTPRVPFTDEQLGLKRLVVHNDTDSEDYLADWIKMCPALEVIKVPTPIKVYLNNWNISNKTLLVEDDHDTLFQPILRLGADNHLQNLKELDTNNANVEINDYEEDEKQFLQEIVSHTDFRLERVSFKLLNSVISDLGFPYEATENFKSRVVSSKGMSEMLKEDLENLEEMWFQRSDFIDTVYLSPWKYKAGNIRLPSLKKIRGEVSTGHLESVEVQDFIDCIFRPDKPRETVTDIHIEYKTENSMESLSILRIHPLYFGKEFPNLTRLALKVRTYTSQELCELLENISTKILLEELWLDTSKGVPEKAFFGVSAESPIFLRLKNLRKLRLDSTTTGLQKGLETERMGNKILEEVFAKMSLTHFEIIGPTWDDMADEGITSLVTGAFGSSILWVRLKDFLGEGKGVVPGKYAGYLETLARKAHSNRLASGITNTTFEEFKASEEFFTGERLGFRNYGWIGEDFSFPCS